VTLEPAGRRWLRLAAWLFLVAMAVFVGWRVEQFQDQQCAALDQFARSLGDELDAPPERIDRFIDRLHDDIDQC
jgi:hypothetical protein